MPDAIKEIDAELNRLDSDLIRIQNLVVESQRKATTIRAQLQVLHALRERLTGEVRGGIGDYSHLPPQKAIIACLTNTPGLTRIKLLDELKDNVKSRAVNARHNVRTTLFQMINNGLVSRNDDGELIVTPIKCDEPPMMEMPEGETDGN